MNGKIAPFGQSLFKNMEALEEENLCFYYGILLYFPSFKNWHSPCNVFLCKRLNSPARKTGDQGYDGTFW